MSPRGPCLQVDLFSLVGANDGFALDTCRETDAGLSVRSGSIVPSGRIAAREEVRREPGLPKSPMLYLHNRATGGKAHGVPTRVRESGSACMSEGIRLTQRRNRALRHVLRSAALRLYGLR